MLYPRTISSQLSDAMKHFPVVLLTGARQVGKSTLALTRLDNYITLDDIVVYASARTDPHLFINSLKKPVVIDEIQKVPELLSAIKFNVDRKRVNGSYLLTGSTNILAYKDIADTLAGRVAIFETFVFTELLKAVRYSEKPSNIFFYRTFDREDIQVIMKTLEEIKEIISQHKDELKKQYGIKEIGIFGSYVRDDQDESSDVDILVEFERPIGFIKFMQLENSISELLGIKVDLVTKKALKPYIGKRILQEVQYV
ncbi:MAG: AAA family ATPase [Candidatus Loosdrechtia sp.]|uniref:AAA family ATPase n=1 Tax=Candidatus Loosdrechtia sp. TaxID=3101272 RepID=UPI003A7636A7|nr:MAG: AAA family ATPase [Candidatus Jettenia sp. AMX2]